jgi:hypothetical protein
MMVPEQPHGSSIQVPAAAEKALQRSIRHTLTSFGSLRKALRDHVEIERRERSLVEIEIDLRTLVARTRLELSRSAETGSQDNLSEHLIEWTDTFFRAPRTHVQLGGE